MKLFLHRKADRQSWYCNESDHREPAAKLLSTEAEHCFSAEQSTQMVLDTMKCVWR